MRFATLVAALGESVPGVESEDRIVDGVAVRVYGTGEPTVAFFHGGGFVFGDLDSHDALCRRLARASGATIVAVDYRRAPEHPHPAALEDCLAVVRALGPVVVAGDSAGGYLAAAVAQREAVSKQVLLYPMLVPPGTDAPHPGDSDLLTRAESHWFWQQYGGPAVTGDLQGLPPAHIVVAGIDPLRDESLAYADALRAAGVAVEVDEYADQKHGFLLCTRDSAEAREAVDALGRSLCAR